MILGVDLFGSKKNKSTGHEIAVVGYMVPLARKNHVMMGYMIDVPEDMVLGSGEDGRLAWGKIGDERFAVVAIGGLKSGDVHSFQIDFVPTR